MLNSEQITESFFMALGRIFDDGKDCHSIHKFISSCISHHKL